MILVILGMMVAQDQPVTLDQKVVQVPLENQDLLGSPEKRVGQDKLDAQDLMEPMENQEHQVERMVMTAFQVLLAQRETLELRDAQVMQEMTGKTADLDHLDQMAGQELMVPLEKMVIKAPLD